MHYRLRIIEYGDVSIWMVWEILGSSANFNNVGMSHSPKVIAQPKNNTKQLELVLNRMIKH